MKRARCRLLLLSLLLTFFLPCARVGAAPGVDALGIAVRTGSRQFVATNKEAGTYYGELRAKNEGGWFGWFVNAEKIVHDYALALGDRALDRETSRATVYPDRTVRQYNNGAVETFTMLDSVDALVIELARPSSAARRGAASLSLQLPDQFSYDTSIHPPARAWKRSAPLAPPAAAGVPSAIVLVPYKTSQGTVFIISAGQSVASARRQADSVFTHRTALAASRRERMDRVLKRGAITTDDKRLTTAFAWAVLSMDALIMRQAVNGVPTTGIFAGLPWFNNYWGRDSFISLAGATYVTGDFTDAREILRSYARFQELDASSTNYGRIPNLATPTSVQYNTADGTPWFVTRLAEYVRTSNDTAFLREMYPVVRRAIEGTLKYHTDSLLFLTHGDAETWMDAVGPEGPWSPRGTRANDIQALWREQLAASATIARTQRDTAQARIWGSDAEVVSENFKKYFLDTAAGRVYDHLSGDGTPSLQVRPNELFCLRMLGTPELERHVTERMLSQLVYPYGTGTLSQLDSNFTPYHHYEPHYVQDRAYHNGIVWTWLNGAAIHAAAQCHFQDAVYPVTQNMVHQILDRGCTGALSELLDAHARPGEAEPRLSGTYLQAWSVAEFIRSMYEDYLGVRIDAEQQRVFLWPRLPAALRHVGFTVTTPDGPIHFRYQHEADGLAITAQSDARVSYTVILEKPNDRPLSQKLPPAASGPAEERTRTMRIPLFPQPAVMPKLARPTLVPYLKALKAPSYPLLSAQVALTQNPRARVLFDAEDAQGDDKGAAGTYTYPSTVHLKPGSLDLVHARVSYDATNMYVALRFQELSDPGWHPEYGFQLTLCAIAIHRAPDDTARVVGVNSQMTLDPSHAWSRMIVVGGGYRVLDEAGKVVCEYRPRTGETKRTMGSTRTKTIEFAVPLSYMGAPSDTWRMTIMAGAQDDHGGAGVGEFRAVELKGGEWTGGGKPDASQPNVYDTLVLGK